ncbi:MAG: glycosyltransferase family 4 protein [Gammaproteobacteria bacterium]
MNIMFVNHVSSKKYGGAERVLDSLIVGLSKVSSPPVLLLQKRTDAEEEPWDCEAQVDVEFFNFGELGGASKLLSLILMLLRMGKALFYVPYLIRKHRLDAICANSLIAAAFCALPARLMGVQFIYYEHNIASQRKNSLIGRALAPVARLSTAIVCISEAVRDGLIDVGVDPAKLHVIHNGYNFSDLDQPAATQDLPKRHQDGVLRIGMVANFIPWKRHARFVRIVDALSEKNPDVQIHASMLGGCLPGSEAYYKEIEQLVEGYDGAATISMLGFQDSIVGHLSSFDILINPADAEPFGLIFVEAMYLGCVAVGSSDGSSSEIIDDGKTGLVLNYEDMPSALEKLSQLAQQPAARKAMGEAAREAVSRRFSMDQQVASFLRLVQPGGTDGSA